MGDSPAFLAFKESYGNSSTSSVESDTVAGALRKLEGRPTHGVTIPRLVSDREAQQKERRRKTFEEFLTDQAREYLSTVNAASTESSRTSSFPVTPTLDDRGLHDEESRREEVWISMQPSTSLQSYWSPSLASESEFSKSLGLGRSIASTMLDYRRTSTPARSSVQSNSGPASLRAASPSDPSEEEESLIDICTARYIQAKRSQQAAARMPVTQALHPSSARLGVSRHASQPNLSASARATDLDLSTMTQLGASTCENDMLLHTPGSEVSQFHLERHPALQSSISAPVSPTLGRRTRMIQSREEDLKTLQTPLMHDLAWIVSAFDAAQPPALPSAPSLPIEPEEPAPSTQQRRESKQKLQYTYTSCRDLAKLRRATAQSFDIADMTRHTSHDSVDSTSSAMTSDSGISRLPRTTSLSPRAQMMYRGLSAASSTFTSIHSSSPAISESKQQIRTMPAWPLSLEEAPCDPDMTVQADRRPGSSNAMALTPRTWSKHFRRASSFVPRSAAASPTFEPPHESVTARRGVVTRARHWLKSGERRSIQSKTTRQSALLEADRRKLATMLQPEHSVFD
ncbi:uncharacterized protein L969DRAFT_94588 [Mixia osmundae IAM 14324]|uniref:Uncharacterized protein n=1 Tax=Mixia osmundae (strain CBS 9802 / IAM 14324 / JCM 22182 / KY 12970) TaxID=764103 RepID=G7DVL4_MIXOS|nr:uncharacterized protein L969DRAFT_94588 [Mixia osmundae IAM 14324]KEI39532.1 hypothetical protein L969DRAFT_94588 [Mixia osmundae IAM 14324]GAA94624.1 hypothetical protein E5Q_01276 [Mixia osmundae IAM 14324]